MTRGQIKEIIDAMSREYMIGFIEGVVCMNPNDCVDIEEFGVTVNNSDDGDGEDFAVYTVCYHSSVGKYGVFVGDDDFFALEELDDDEIERVYDAVVEQKTGTDGDQTPYTDIVEYGERYGLEALGLAVLEAAQGKEAVMGWDLARSIWERGGKI